jgi:hypothetical protein
MTTAFALTEACREVAARLGGGHMTVQKRPRQGG